MAAKVLTREAAAEAKIALIDGGRGSQAVHDAVVAMRAARRSGSAKTKTKAEVNLSGAKPWRQKGTGRARAGYKSSPIWRGGGVVFGPKPRDYSKKISKSVRRLAFQKALSERVDDGDVLTVSDFAMKEVKTKSFLTLLRKQTEARRVLIISDGFDENTYRSARNVKPVQLARATDVNTEQLLACEKVLVTDVGLAKLSLRMSSASAPGSVVASGTSDEDESSRSRRGRGRGAKSTGSRSTARSRKSKSAGKKRRKIK